MSSCKENFELKTTLWTDSGAWLGSSWYTQLIGKLESKVDPETLLYVNRTGCVWEEPENCLLTFVLTTWVWCQNKPTCGWEQNYPPSLSGLLNLWKVESSVWLNFFKWETKELIAMILLIVVVWLSAWMIWILIGVSDFTNYDIFSNHI